MKKLILASQSPRRRMLLENIGLKFEILVDDAEEEKEADWSPEKTVMALAEQKVVNVAKGVVSPAIIIGADTVVAVDGEILGKPKDEQKAAQMLCRLSGQEHCVFTGVAVLDTETGEKHIFYEQTKVRFKPLTAEEIQRYIASGEPMDKAGAYGIQELGSLFVEGIDGDYFNVVGLPVCRLAGVLQEQFGICIL